MRKMVLGLVLVLLLLVVAVVYFGFWHRDDPDTTERQGISVNSVLDEFSSIPDSANIFSSSTLEKKSCLDGGKLKVCFDDRWGGTFSGVYRKDFSNSYNFLYPTAGGSLQVAVRSKDSVNRCPGSYGEDWLSRWNPTQAGCEACWTTNNGTVAHLASNTANKTVSNDTYSIDIRPRSYFHDNLGDCNNQVKYTSGTGLLDEDIYIKETAQMFSDYLQVNWDIKHVGNHTHELDSNSKYFRQELPTFYVNDSDICFELAYTDEDGVVQTKRFPCKKGTDEFIDFKDGWLSFYNPKNSKQALTIAAKNNVDSGKTFETTFRNYDTSSRGAQLDFSSFFAIEPNMSFQVQFIILPYKWDETMSDGTKVVDFISSFETGEPIVNDGTGTDTGGDITTGSGTCGAIDVNNDLKISIVDFAAFVKIYGQSCEPSTETFNVCGAQDTNGDGKISIIDFASFVKKYNNVCE